MLLNNNVKKGLTTSTPFGMIQENHIIPHKKGIKTMLKGILITALIASLTGVNTKAVRVYPLTAICTEVNQNKNTVTFTDFNGEGWKIEECECWEKGDVVAMLISDNATPNNVHDDVIIDIYYQGR